MLKRLLLISLFAIPIFAQDVPKMRPWSLSDLQAEIGSLHIQIRQRDEFIETLKARVAELQAENAKLKGETK